MVVRGVVNIFPDPPIFHDAGAFQLGEMTGDARLAHAQNFLQLSHRKLFLPEKKEQTQAGWVCQQSEQINC